MTNNQKALINDILVEMFVTYLLLILFLNGFFIFINFYFIISILIILSCIYLILILLNSNLLIPFHNFYIYLDIIHYAGIFVNF